MSYFSRKQSFSGYSLTRLVFSIAVPVVLLLVFLGGQCINFNSIGWSHGFAHPLTGWDHLVTMLAVGIWAAQLRGNAIWMLPLAFVSVMSLGGLAGASGLDIPSVDGIILVSCAVFSILITRKVRFSSKINVLIVAFFAFFHGFAHGQEISTSASLISYTLGFMLATLLLHGAGILVAKLVVLAVTCLLTVLFSSSALAKATESVFDMKSHSETNTHQTIVNFSASLYISTQERSYDTDGLDLDGNRLRINHLSKLYDSGGGLFSEISQFSEQPTDMANSQMISRQGKHHAGVDYYAPTIMYDLLNELENYISLIFYPNYTSDCKNLDFKNYYPDINHTPGKNLLSNGVGLTSPPLLIKVVSAFHASSAFPKFHNSSSEDLFLQLSAAKIDFGNSYTEISHHIRQTYALGKPFKALKFRFNTPCKNNCPKTMSKLSLTGGLSLALIHFQRNKLSPQINAYPAATDSLTFNQYPTNSQ